MRSTVHWVESAKRQPQAGMHREWALAAAGLQAVGGAGNLIASLTESDLARDNFAGHTMNHCSRPVWPQCLLQKQDCRGHLTRIKPGSVAHDSKKLMEFPARLLTEIRVQFSTLRNFE